MRFFDDGLSLQQLVFVLKTGGGIKFYYKLAETAGRDKRPVPPTNCRVPISAPAAGSKFPFNIT